MEGPSSTFHALMWCSKNYKWSHQEHTIMAMLHQVFLLTFLFFPPLFNLSSSIIYIYCLGTIVQKISQACTLELLHIPNNFFSLTNNIVKRPNACSACNAPCQRKKNHIAFTHSNPSLSLQPFNVTNEQKTWRIKKRSWNVCLDAFWILHGNIIVNSIANSMHWYYLHNYQTLPQVLKGGGM